MSHSKRLLVALTLISARPVPPPVLPYKNASLPTEQRVTDLLTRMTLGEKIAQLDMYWAKEVATLSAPKGDGHKPVDWDPAKPAPSLRADGAGSVHDPYPLTA